MKLIKVFGYFQAAACAFMGSCFGACFGISIGNGSPSGVACVCALASFLAAIAAFYGAELIEA